MNKIINIMPMAGLGKRFLNKNYNLPKPLIKINKKPMFLRAFESMPNSKTNIFICHQNLINKYKINKLISKKLKKKFKLVKVNKTTKGQANSYMLASKLLNNKDKVFIHSCDSLINYDKLKLIESLNNYDAVILTTKPNKNHLNNINSYGWVSIRKSKIKKITCKRKASLNPNKDNVIIGSFAFKNKKIFDRIIKDLLKSKKTINNEYYIDMAFSHALENKFKIKNFTVKSYISWGTPNELKSWENKIAKNR